MASSSQLFAIHLVIAAIFFVPSVLATYYHVGDGNGWTTNFDYQAWAKDKTFFVGDRLVFVYQEGSHNVLKVNGTAFKACQAPENIAPLTSGNDIILLATPGNKWYFCGIASHCQQGQKLVITVLPAVDAPAPAPWAPPPPTPIAPPPSAAMRITSPGLYGLMKLASFGLLGVILA